MCLTSSPPPSYGIYQCCHCTPDCTKIPLSGCDTLQTFLCTMVKGSRTFLAFEDGLRCRFRHYNHPFKGWKLVLETIYFEGWCTSKQVEKVLKVKLKFRGSQSGRPTDDLLWSSGRPTAILGVRTPGRPLNLHAASQLGWNMFMHKRGESLLNCKPVFIYTVLLWIGRQKLCRKSGNIFF